MSDENHLTRRRLMQLGAAGAGSMLLPLQWTRGRASRLGAARRR